MNILVLFVSCVIISCTSAIPKSKHKHIKVPLNKVDNSKYQETNGRTALQILEDHLLKPNKNLLNKYVILPRKRRRTKTTFNSCFAAFGEKSHLCYSRRNIKGFDQKCISKRHVTRPFFPAKRFKGSPKHPIAHRAVDDFFSIFTSETSTVSSIAQSSEQQISSFEIENLKSFSTMLNQTISSPISIIDKFKPSFENLEGGQMSSDKVTLQGGVETSFENNSLFASAGDILPHSQTSRSHGNKTELLFLERVGDPRRSANQFFNEGEDFNNNSAGVSAVFGMFTDSSHFQEGISNSTHEPNSLADITPSYEENHSEFKFVTESVFSDSHSSPDHHHSQSESVMNQAQSSQELQTATYLTTSTQTDFSGQSKDIKSRQAVEYSTITSFMDKATCEMTYKKTCICYFVSLEKELRDIFQQAAYPRTIYQEISQISCRYYVPKPETFQLSSHLKPKVLSANRKPMAVDEDSGPKEIEASSLERFIKESSSVDDDVLFVFVNYDVTIPCFPTNDVHLSASDADHVKYKWTRDDKIITDGRMVENSDGEGTLSIDDTSLADSGMYTCEVDYVNPDTGQHTEDSFSHNVSVVTLPIVTVRVSIHYRASTSCDASVLEEFQLYLPQLTEEALCSSVTSQRLCSVEVHSPVCHTNGNERSHRQLSTNYSSTTRTSSWLQNKIEEAIHTGLGVDTPPRLKREDSMEMSLNTEVYIHRSAEKDLSSVNASVCDATCHLLITFKLLQMFKESMRDIAFTPVTTTTDNGVVVFSPVEKSIGIKYIFGCIGGYHLNKGFCSACPKHTYSEDGATECSPCPPHTYQGALGARKCIPCTNAWTPACNEYFESSNYAMIVLVVAVVVALLVGFILWYLLFVRKKKFTEMGKKFIPKSSTKKRKIKTGKSQKRVRTHDVPMVQTSQSSATVDELQELINTSPEETADEGEENQNVKTGRRSRNRR